MRQSDPEHIRQLKGWMRWIIENKDMVLLYSYAQIVLHTVPIHIFICAHFIFLSKHLLYTYIVVHRGLLRSCFYYIIL